MRLASFSVTVFLALMSSAVQAQQSPGAPGDTIGHPPPLPGPPPLSDPSATARPVPATGPAPTGYTGAYAPAGTPPIPYSLGPLPQSSEVSSDGVSPHERSKRCLAGSWHERPMGLPPVWESPIKVLAGVGAGRHRRNRVRDGIDVSGDLGRPAAAIKVGEGRYRMLLCHRPAGAVGATMRTTSSASLPRA
jgi:hypothetical protein